MAGNLLQLRELLNEQVSLLHKLYGWFDEEELAETPRRIFKFYEDFGKKSTADFNFTTFSVHGKSNLITIKNIEFYSICAHHLLPFFGKIGIAYLSWDEKDKGVYAGVSKFGRAVEKFASKPQTQEIMTEELTEYLWTQLHPKFLFLQVSNAKHLCMIMRGIKQHEPKMGTNGIRWDESIDSSYRQSLKEEAINELKE